jgi:radical SAM superfamily enzyme YgiQ (UPF0313 family)
MNITKILLIWPANELKVDPDSRTRFAIESLRFPLGIGYLAAYIEQELDVEVQLLDMVAEKPESEVIGDKMRIGMRNDELEDRIRAFEPDMVGVSQMFSYLEPVCEEIFQIAKSIDPKIVTVWGGTHPTTVPRETLSCPDVDYIVLGEGEAPLKELVERLNAGQSTKGMKSIRYRDENGEMVICNERSWIEDLDHHVLPARHKVDMGKYLGATKEANMVASRGCPFSCTFCTAPTMYQKRFMARSPEKVVEEMEFLVEEYGVREFIFQDENITFNMDRIEAVADLIIEKKMDVRWFAEVGVLISRLNERLIHKLAKSGYSELRLPVESGDAEILHKMKKPLKLTKVQPIVNAARDAGLKVVSFLLLGLPGETEENIRTTAAFALETGFDWNVLSLILPLPVTAIYNDMIEQGKIIDYVDLEKYASPIDGTSDLPTEQLIDLRVELNDMLNFEQNYNMTRGNLHIALGYFEEMTLRYPGLSKSHHFLGLAKYKNGDPRGALESFLRAAEIESKKYNSADWVQSLESHLKNASSTDTYLPEEMENELRYAYGHISQEVKAASPAPAHRRYAAGLAEV